MLIKSLAVSLLVGATLYTFPAYATTAAPDLAPAAALQETAADPSAPQLVASEPTAPVTLDSSEPALDPGRSGLQQKYSLSPSSTTGNIDRFDGKYLKGYFRDAGKVLSAPMRWDAGDWMKAGITLGVTSSLFLVDQDVKNFSQSHQSPVATKFDTVGNALGNGFYILPGLGAAYLYGHFADNHKVRRTALLALESYAISGLMTEGMKLVAERHRPNTGDNNTSFDGPTLHPKNVSFSSGHTASAFSIATIIANEYKDSVWVGPVAYGLASLTGLSRIYSDAHWSSDVFFGAAIGYFTSKALLAMHKEDSSPLFSNRLSLMPKFGKQLTGVEMKYQF